MHYQWDERLHLYKSSNAAEFSYSDGLEVEQRLLHAVSSVADRSTFSSELLQHIQDWPSEYHLSRSRHCLVRPLNIAPGTKVLELGCGCGAITRFLGEIGAEVVAVEGSLLRGQVAAERCRDLPNVRVYVDNLLHFSSDEQFDYVLLVGVLEYAAMFAPSADPFAQYLEAVIRFLAPRGIVALAIENQLGLKYFNACPEDHVGKLYYGIQDLYSDHTPRTFGRRELASLLSSAGLPNLSFYYPFPDYKLPSVVLAEGAVDDPQFDAADLLVRCQARNYDGSSSRNFDEALAFSVLARNRLLGELSNSFLVLASRGPIPVEHEEIATAYSIHRAPAFCTQTRFVRDNDKIRVLKERLNSVPSPELNLYDQLTIRQYLDEAAYYRGRQLYWHLLKARAQSPELASIVQALRPWMNFLLQQSHLKHECARESCTLSSLTIPGKFLDCTPSNLLASEGEFVPIDLEWQSDKDIPLGWVLTRGVLWSLGSGVPSRDDVALVLSIVNALAAGFDLSFAESDVRQWLDSEAAFQSFVLGRPFENNLAVPSSQVSQELQEEGRTFQEGSASANQEDAPTEQPLPHQQASAIGPKEFVADARANPLLSHVLVEPSRTSLVARALLWLPGRLRQRRVARFLLKSGLFDAQYYLNSNKDVADAGINPLRHYLMIGATEGRRPNPYFDSRYYLRQYPDVAASDINPLLHYLAYGYKEGREPGETFSGTSYLQHNSDVRNLGVNPLSHYLRFGRAEGRAICPLKAPPMVPAPAPVAKVAVVSSSDPWDRAAALLQARDESHRLLLVDYQVPTPDKDSGSVRIYGIAKLLVDLGFKVTFASHDPHYESKYSAALASAGIALLAGEHEIRSHLQQKGGGYSVAIVSRPEMAATYFAVIRAYAPQAELVYDSVDLHALRVRRGVAVTGGDESDSASNDYAALEEFSFGLADRIIAITDVEQQAILQQHPTAKVEVVPNVHSVTVLPQPWAQRAGLLFIGGFHHPPNQDAVFWFVEQVLPIITKSIPDIRFTIIGSNITKKSMPLTSADVNVVGWVADPDPYFATSRIFVAPLRYGAGMKGKVGQAMGLGLPVVTTSVGAEGMGLSNHVQAMIADGADSFAQATIELYQDEVKWNRMRMAAAAHVEQRFSERAVRGILQGVFPRDVHTFSTALEVLA